MSSDYPPNHRLNGDNSLSADKLNPIRRKLKQIREQRNALQQTQYKLVNEINVLRATIRNIIAACDEDGGSAEATDKNFPVFRHLRNRVAEDMKL